MKIINIKKVPRVRVREGTLFTGEVVRQSPVKDSESRDFSVDFIHFKKGVRNKFHKHSSDQVLLVTRGEGVFATKKKKFNLQKGDIVLSPKGEIHYHGASPGREFTHVSITKAHTKLTQMEK